MTRISFLLTPKGYSIITMNVIPNETSVEIGEATSWFLQCQTNKNCMELIFLTISQCETRKGQFLCLWQCASGLKTDCFDGACSRRCVANAEGSV